ncbi:hypothetical protein EVAR_77835_1 [Eumeta japonica]|uniref:Uncharacterized protein n=1 Tax=Eumeta variegata TaxID=151549 RepID=A0A4C1TEA3_EUMVA|nr:hypothetical protein EVAR_77835_1 [Eumeta japonica]
MLFSPAWKEAEVIGIHKPGNHATSCQLQTDQPLSEVLLKSMSRRALKPNNSTVAVFFDVAKAFDRVWHTGMSGLTQQDVLSELEFLKAPPSLPCCIREHKRYTATVVVWRSTRVIRGRYRALLWK